MEIIPTQLVDVSLPDISYNDINIYSIPLDLGTSQEFPIFESPAAPRILKGIIVQTPEESKPTQSLPEIKRPIIIKNLKESNGILKFSMDKVIIPRVESPPVILNKDPAALALAYRLRQNVAQILLDIVTNIIKPEVPADKSEFSIQELIDFIEAKLIPGRASDSSKFSLQDIKDIAKKLGLKTSKSKDALISDIKQILLDFRSKS